MSLQENKRNRRSLVDKITETENFVRRVMAPCVDKSGVPTIEHVERVARAVSIYPTAVRQTAWLHDVVEDTSITIFDLRNMEYSITVVQAVNAITKHVNESYEQYIERVAQNPIAKKVKIADLKDNMTGRDWPFGDKGPDDWMWQRYSKALRKLTK